MLNKTLQILYLIIGLFVLFMMSRDIVNNGLFGLLYDYSPSSDIYVGTKLGESLKKGEIPQGITYGQPEEIPNSDYKILPLSVTTYEQAKDVADFEAIEDYAHIEDPLGSISSPYGNHVNVLFLDKNYQFAHQLLDTLGLISAIQLPFRLEEKPDTTIRNILYLIGFRDTNKDNLMNYLDDKDLYISNLDGSNLIKISSGVNVEAAWFRDNNSIVLIQYTSRSKEANEHKRKQFALYDIQAQKLKKLDRLTEKINNIEAQLTKTAAAK